MHVLDAGGRVQLLRFLPDGRRVLVGVTDVELSHGTADVPVRFFVLPVAGGDRVPLDLPPLSYQRWAWSWYGHVIAAHPSGDRCWAASKHHLYACLTADGRPLPVSRLNFQYDADQVALSPDGQRLLTAGLTPGHKVLCAYPTEPDGGDMLWAKPLLDEFVHLAGFLHDGERVVTIDDRVRVHSLADGTEVASAGYPAGRAEQPTLSPDGRHLAVNSHSSLYLYDLADLGKPRQIKASSNFGDFRSFAFHPDGKTLAVIHGGPTLLKLYDLETLKQTRKYNWKVGPLTAVAFSPDGQLGAVGTEDGRVVVWDIES